MRPRTIAQQRRAIPFGSAAGRGRLTKRLPHGGVPVRRTFIGPDEYVLEQINFVQFINPEGRLGVELLWNVGEGERLSGYGEWAERWPPSSII